MQPEEPLAAFAEPTRAWFSAAFAAPTAAQAGAWGAISAGQHALVVAPTGSGKTLAAFLWSLDRLFAEPAPDERRRRCRVLYVSPLKALAVDVERNLRAPLAGIRATADRLGVDLREITVGLRSGDTPAAERRRLQTTPPDVLITTPESLFLMLTSRARESLAGVETVIVDEVHAVAGTKRGAHLALSLERLDALLERPAQRIGLSATVRPVEEVARFVGGTAPVEVVAPPAEKRWDLRVLVPVADMTQLDDPGQESERKGSLWPHVEERVVDLVEEHRSTLVFVNSRRVAERLTSRLNEVHAQRLGVAAAESIPTAVGDPGAARTEGAAEPWMGLAPRAGAEAAETARRSEAGENGLRRLGDPTGGRDVVTTAATEVWPEPQPPPVLARAHHGSVSKEQRAAIEDDLKRGRLPCVVATSSLELGIDMGAVDLVVQIESPPSVSSGVQRVGRSGHRVGEVSRGALFPTHRGDLLPTAVAVERMLSGQIEALRIPANPLDVLAQQLVAATALDDWDADELFALVRRTASFAGLGRGVFDATVDLLAGRYPSDEFAGLRPRLVWDRVTGRLSGRPGAQRLAVTSGGTIPDRGLFGVFLIAGEGPGRRVGELDEEMVYESRVGDVFTLGTSSWRIEDITHDRVLVSPAPGQPGRLPFWKGDQPGRPAELGAAVGAFAREVASLSRTEALARAQRAGLDEWAAGNLVDLLDEQREATRVIPHDRQLVVERFRDELGDWRLVVHSPYGARVHEPWALLIGARLRERYGVDAQAMAADDGVVLRVPETDQDPPGAELMAFAPDEIADLVTAEVGGSALFASRFRECAARALLLPRRDPGRRSPLWQQRQRSAQLLEVAARYPGFPIVLETVREVLQDVYDVPALVELQRGIAQRRVALVDVDTLRPSPFAQSLLFGYVAAFMYEGDSPLAERRAAALTLDQGLLAELLGRAELRELLDPEVLAEVESELQRLAPDRRARDAEGVVDVLRLLGPLTTAEVAARADCPATEALERLEAARRVVRVRVAGEPRWAVIEDVARLRDGLGVPAPPGTPEAFCEPVPDPLGDLVGRHARTHGPFTAGDVAGRLGLGVAVVRQTLIRLAAQGRVLEGEFRPAGSGTEWCDAEVLRRLRRRSLARLRREVEPVAPEVLGRFLPAWQRVAARHQNASAGHAEGQRPSRAPRGLRGLDGVVSAVEQLAGCAVPASAWETLVLPARVVDYEPAMLDELTATGELLWAGHGALPGSDGWVSLHVAESSPLTLPEPTDLDLSPAHEAILSDLAGGGAFFFRVGAWDLTALWELVWSGRVGNDTLAPLRALARTGGTHRSRRPPPRARLGRPGRAPGVARSGPPGAAGRWFLLPDAEPDPTRRAHALAEGLLDRHGVVTRGAVVAEHAPGGFAATYRVLSAFEESGRCRRGYFVEGLGAAQFGTAGAVDRLRAVPEPAAGDEPVTVVLAATDPASPYGAALPWPERPGGHRPGRKAGALVVLVDGALAVYVERGGRTLLTWASGDLRDLALSALGDAVRRGALGTLSIEKVDGVGALSPESADLRSTLEDIGFVPTSRGLRMRG